MLETGINGGNNSQNNQAYGVKFIKPDLIVQEIGIGAGAKVADFGCGGGYFSLPISRKVGENGVVYALDILPQSLEMIEGYAKTMGLNNIIPKRVNLEKMGGSKLEEESCDWVIMKDMLFQNKDKGIIIKEACRVLKQGGKALVIEWNSNDSSIGPGKDLRIAKESLLEIIHESGMGVLKEIPISDFHYGLILVK
jgi:ubiquinone/menaquinone biosynthesis C-methylase UbiE